MIVNKNKKNNIVILVLFVCFVITSYNAFSFKYEIGFNTTDSLQGYIFLIKKNEVPKIGQLVAFYPPKNIRVNIAKKFIKKVIAKEGDHISWKDHTFKVNGIEYGVAKKLSRKGELLEKGYKGVIGHNLFFMYSSHQDSYDSRYKDIGLVSVDRIIGIAYKII